MVKKTKKKLLIWIGAPLAAALVAVGAYTAVALAQGWWPYTQTPSQETPATEDNDMNTEDPTYGSEKNGGTKTDETPYTPPLTDDGKKSVSVNVSFNNDGGFVRVLAYVSDVVEEGGSCTATFTKGGVTKSYSSTAFTDFSSSRCEAIEAPVSDLSSGVWQLRVSYSSDASEGTSSSVEVEI